MQGGHSHHHSNSSQQHFAIADNIVVNRLDSERACDNTVLNNEEDENMDEAIDIARYESVIAAQKAACSDAEEIKAHSAAKPKSKGFTRTQNAPAVTRSQPLNVGYLGSRNGARQE